MEQQINANEANAAPFLYVDIIHKKTKPTLAASHILTAKAGFSFSFIFRFLNTLPHRR